MPSDPYVDALENHLRAMKQISLKLIKKLKMELGEQPDENYNDKHLSRSKRITSMQNLNGKEDKGDYSGLSGWGG